MARHEHLLIYKAALDMSVHFENLVADFSLCQKYTLGTELCEASRGVLMQVGAFVEQLQWPPRRLPSARRAADAARRGALRRMRPTRRGAARGFPLAQLDRRMACRVAAGNAVTFVAQRGESGGGLMRRVPVARWAPGSAQTGVNERPV
jgi:hypothetical protein